MMIAIFALVVGFWIGAITVETDSKAVSVVLGVPMMVITFCVVILVVIKGVMALL